MPLKGDLQSIELSSVFQLLVFNQKEGVLKVKEIEVPYRERSLFFTKAGVTIFFDSRECRHLAEFLIHRGDLLPSDLKKLKTFLPDDLEGYLRGLQLLEGEQRGIGQFLEEELYDLFFWNQVNFEFEEGPLCDASEGSILPDFPPFPMDSIVMEAARRVDEWETIRDVAPGHEDIFIRQDDGQPLPPDERESNVLSLVDGIRSVTKIVSLSRSSRVHVYREIVSLVQQGLIRPLDLEELKRIASQCVRENRLDDGFRLFKKAINEKPDDADLHELIAKIYERQKENQKALNHYRAVGTLLQKQGKIEEAFRVFLHALEIVPTDLLSLTKLIEIGLENRELCHHYSFVLPERIRVLAQIYRHLGKNQEVIGLLRNVLDHGVNRVDFRKELIHVLLEEGERELAVEESKVLAEHFVSNGKKESAVKAYTKALMLDGTREDIRRELKLLKFQEENASKRKRRVRISASLFVPLVILIVGYICYVLYAHRAFDAIQIDSLIRSGRLEEARRILRDFYRRYPLNPVRAKVETELDRIENAIARRYTTGSIEDPLTVEERARSLYKEALGALEEGSLDEARTKFNTILSIEGKKRWVEQEEVREKFHQVDTYLREASALFEEGKKMEEWGKTERAFEAYLQLMREYPLFCKKRTLIFPFRIDSIPPGAEIFKDGKNTSKLTPSVLHLPPGEKVKILLQKDGFAGKEVALSIENGCTIQAPLEKRPFRFFDFGKPVLGFPAFTEESLFGVREDGLVRALDFHTGKMKWEKKLSGVGDVESGIVRASGKLFIGSKDSYVYCLDEVQGECIWKFKTGGFVTGAPKVADEVLFAGSMDGILYALDVETGKVLWKFQGNGGFAASPVIRGESIYLGSTSGSLYQIEKKTGSQIKSFSGAGPLYASPLVTNAFLYAGSDDGNLYAFDLKNGKLAWKYQGGAKIRSSPQADKGRLFFGADNGKLCSLDSHFGTELSSITVPGRIRSTPLITEETIYFGSGDGFFYAFHTSDLSLKWKAPSGGEILSSPMVSKGGIFVTSSGGTLQEYRE